MDSIENPHPSQTTPSGTESRIPAEHPSKATASAGSAGRTGRGGWRHRVRRMVLGIAAGATIAVAGAGAVSAQEAAAAGVPTHNYAVLTQTVHLPSASAEPKGDDD